MKSVKKVIRKPAIVKEVIRKLGSLYDDVGVSMASKKYNRKVYISLSSGLAVIKFQLMVRTLFFS